MGLPTAAGAMGCDNATASAGTVMLGGNVAALSGQSLTRVHTGLL